MFPYVQELAECIEAKKKSLTTPQVWLKVGATESRFKLLCPKTYDAVCKSEGASPAAGAVATGQGASPAAGSVAQGQGESPAAGEPGAGATEEEEATPPFVDMFWELYKRKGLGRGKLTMRYSEICVPISCFQIKDAAVRAGICKAGNNVDMLLPCLTDEEELCKGDSLGYLS